MSIIERFRQWVSHRMDAHWRRQKVALRKKQNTEEWRAKKNYNTCSPGGDDMGARASALYLEGRCVFCEKTKEEKGKEEWDNCSCSK